MKGLFVFSNHMEDLESLGTKALLVRAGLDIKTITFEKSLDITTAFHTKIKADDFGKNITYHDYDFVVIPGGRYVAMVIDQDIEIQKLIKEFDKKGKLIAAICAAPRFLGRSKILDGRSFTAFTGSEVDIPHGKYLPSKKAVRDQHIITGRSAGSIYEFAYEIVKYLLGEEKAKALYTNIIY